MKRRLLCSALLPIALLSVATAVFADNLKIAVVDLKIILEKAPQVMAMRKQLDDQFRPKRDEIKQLQKGLQTVMADLKKNAAVMGDAQRKKLEDKIIQDRRKLDDMVLSFSNEFTRTQDTLLQDFKKQLNAAVTTLAKQSNIDLVIAKEGGALYAKENLDVTPQLLVTLKK